MFGVSLPPLQLEDGTYEEDRLTEPQFLPCFLELGSGWPTVDGVVSEGVVKVLLFVLDGWVHWGWQAISISPHEAIDKMDQ